MKTRITFAIPKLLADFYNHYSISLFFKDFIWKFFTLVFIFIASWQLILITTLVALVVYLWIICSPTSIAKIIRKMLSKLYN